MDYLDYIDFMDGIPNEPPLVRNDIDPFRFYNDYNEFKDRFRFDKGALQELIALLTPPLGGIATSNRGRPTPIWKKVLVAIRYFADGTFHRETGDLLGVSEASACRYVHEVASAICRTLRREYIQFPTGNYAARTKHAFFAKYGFPGVLSCIDGTHVPIMSPPTEDKEEYRNRKGIFSINVLATAGADLEFTNIVARWKSSTHDSRIFVNSSLYARFERGDFNGLLLGDSGFRRTSFLMTPLTDPQTPPQTRYQRALKKARSTVERMFGKWKNRFRCLHSQNTLRFSPRKCCTIIIACAVLHNFGIRRRQWDLEDENEIFQDFEEEDVGDCDE